MDNFSLQHSRSAIRNFLAVLFLVSGQYFKDYHKILVSSTLWIDVVNWIASIVKMIAGWSVQVDMR